MIVIEKNIILLFMTTYLSLYPLHNYFRKLLLPFLSSFFLIIFFLGFPGACLVKSTGSEKLSRLDMLCHTKIISSVPKIFCRKYFQDFSSISEGNRLTVR